MLIITVTRLVERRMPGLGQWLKKWFVERWVPANKTFGIKIEEITADSGKVVLRLPYRRRNLNVGGTVHGGVIIALAETVHGVAVLWQFSPGEHFMVTKKSRTQFMAPARGELITTFELDPGTRRQIDTELTTTGRCEIELASVVTNRSGKTVAKLEAVYYIRRRAAATST